jgi:putative ABC transport system ATP-binding protein
VWFDGVPLDRLSERERTWRRRPAIGFVFQFFNLLPTLTVLENVRLPLELGGTGPAAASRRAREWLARVGLAERAGTFADRLSGGEQQRVAVVRALVHEPALVLADEPTGNLDGETAREVLDLLTGLVRERGASLVLVTHSAEAAARADRGVEIRDHRIAPAPEAAAPGAGAGTTAPTVGR